VQQRGEGWRDGAAPRRTMYGSVPQPSPRAVPAEIVACSELCDSPKSLTPTSRPPALMRTFCGFRSRCTMPRMCIAASARRTACPMRSASARGRPSACSSFTRSSADPSYSGSTSAGERSHTVAPSTGQTNAHALAAASAARTSRSRPRISASGSAPPCKTFSAQGTEPTPSRCTVPSYTVAKPAGERLGGERSHSWQSVRSARRRRAAGARGRRSWLALAAGTRGRRSRLARTARMTLAARQHGAACSWRCQHAPPRPIWRLVVTSELE